jgi:hypothetical protein
MPAPDAVLKLCETFAEHREHFRSGNYNEFQLRKQFLDPLFEALGWDMANSQGLAPQYRDVIHEDAIKIGPHVKAPDYAFTLHGQRKFFLEAKKPSVNIKGDVAPAYQLRRYAWSAKLPLSILSDFEEFAIYDTRIKPAPGDPSSKARVFYCTCDQFAEKWDEIAAIFSRDAILKGSFDKYADSAKKKKGTAEVDTAFLEEIERWRDLLARNFALRNPALNVRDLNFAVQKTIDRLVFLRICEDRGTEDYGRLRIVANGTQTYPRLLELFRAADARYNSGLFHFSKEKGQAEEPDTLTPNLALDDKTLKDIIAHLYYPDSPYEFSVLPADILGSVYERFLGKTIRLTDGHQAKIEEKPEVRKAGGVYYTPSYIVDYIVQNTLGVLLNGRADRPDSPTSPPEAETTARRAATPYLSLDAAAKLKVVDPACGSGSFLIVAYQFLLDWHRDRYAENPEKWSKGKTATLYQAKGGEWRLTTAEKKRILLNNIHGVDIDAAAVEVTKLSLLLKVLEGETGEIAQRDFLKERERILPDLANNIKCGNSLIGPDFYDVPEMDLLDDEARYRVNVFDWKTGFPEVFKQGGFDCVIGNPPYGALLSRQEVSHLVRKFPSASKFPDSYCMFMAQGMKLLRQDGCLSFIVPNTFCDLENCAEFRRMVLIQWTIERIWQSGWAFRDAVVDTLVFTASNIMPDSTHEIRIEVDTNHYYRQSASFLQQELQKIDYRNREEDKMLQARIGEKFVQLGQVAVVKAGVKMYEKGKGNPPQTQKTMEERPFSKRGECPPGWRALLRGTDVIRYGLSHGDEFVNYGHWLAAPRSPDLFDGIRILMRRTDDRILACLEFGNSVCVNSCHVIKLNEKLLDHRAEYVLGLINSKLVQRIFAVQNPQMVGKVFAEIKVIYVERLPIRPIDFTNPADVEKHDRMVSLVDKMLALVPKRRAEANPQAAAQLDAQIAATDRQIDRLVYDLYGLTEEEIALVEGV